MGWTWTRWPRSGWLSLGLLMVDGQGQAHPRGFGIACHLGVRWDVPSIGVAKTFRYGKYDAGALGDAAGSSVPLLDRTGQHLTGSTTRPKARTNPLFLSPGHRVSVESTTRQAHTLITTFKKAGAAGLMTAAPVPTQEAFFLLVLRRSAPSRPTKQEG